MRLPVIVFVRSLYVALALPLGAAAAQAPQEASTEPSPADASSQSSPGEVDPSQPEVQQATPSDVPVLVVAGDAPDAGQPPGPAPSSGPAETLEVTVVGTSVAKTAGSAHILNERQLERFDYDDPHAVLGAVPGVYARGEDGLGLRPNISLRGVNPDRSSKVALMEDGIPFGPAPYSAPAAYYFPLITRISQVRVIKGPAAISFGPQTVAGAIDLVTRPVPSETRGAFDLAAGQYGYGKAHGYFGSSTDEVGFLVEGVHVRSDGFKELPSGGDTGFHRNEWMFKARYTPDPGTETLSEWLFKATYSDELSNETYLGLTDADFRVNPLQRYEASRLDRMTNHRTAFSLQHRVEPSETLAITTSLYRHDFFRTWRRVDAFRGAQLLGVLTQPESAEHAIFYPILSGQQDSTSAEEALLIGPNQRQFVSQGIQTRLDYSASSGPLRHRVEYGMRVHYDRIERQHTRDAFQIVAGAPIPEGSPTITAASNEASTTALALHAVDAISLGNVTLTPGVRFETLASRFTDLAAGQETRGTAQAVLPGVGLYYGLTRDIGVLAGAYRGFSPPSPGSGEAVESEFSINYEVGARVSAGQSRAELIGFFNDYSNLTDVCTFSNGCLGQDLDRQFDAGSARIYGLEAYATHSPTLAGLTFPLTAAYTLTRAEFTNSFTSDDPIYGQVSAGDELPYVPAHRLNASVGVETARLQANLGLDYVAAVREQAGSEPLSQTLSTERALVLDANVKYRVLEPLLVYLNVRNLASDLYIVSHRPFGARPNAPRWVQLGGKVEF